MAVVNTGYDDRDPKLLATEDKLYVYFFSCWFSAVDGTLRQNGYTHLTWSSNGSEWATPVRIHKQNYWLWRIRKHGNTFYSPEKGGELLASSDCLNWEKVSRIPVAKDDYTDLNDPDFDARSITHKPCNSFSETDCVFRTNGELWCVTRTNREPDDTIFYRSKPPYTKWDWVDLKTRIHCPVLCECDGVVYVAGRRTTATAWKTQPTPAGNTGIFILAEGKVDPFLALASEGDAAYPGLIRRRKNRLLISYYSQHAYLNGVIQADTYAQDFLQDTEDKGPRMSGPADIFIAEIDTKETGHEVRF